MKNKISPRPDIRSDAAMRAQAKLMATPVPSMPMKDEILALTCAGRWAHPAEVGGTAVYLAPGTAIRVDGG